MRKLTLADFDHPIPFLFFTTLAVVAIAALAGMGLAKLGWSGPAAIFGQSAA